METEQLGDQIEAALRRIDMIRRQAIESSSNQQTLLKGVLEELGNLAEKLRAVSRNLHEQRQDLMNVREAVEREREQYKRAFESAPLLASVVEFSDDAIISMTLDGVIVSWNSGAERIYGYRAEEAIGQPISILIPANRSSRVSDMLKSLAEGERFDHYETVRVSKDGRLIDISLTLSPIKDGSGKVIGASSIGRDVTERKQAEMRLREHAALLNHARDAVFVEDLENRLVFWNRSAERIYGWTASEAIGRNVRELLNGEETLEQFEEAQRKLFEEGEWTGELRQNTKYGRAVIVESRWALVRDDDGQPKSILVINTDITEKKELEAHFLRAQRMESIGTLAAGIAHDINNVLSPILIAVEALRVKFKDEESQYFLAMLKINTERGAALVNQVLSFARGIDEKSATLQPKYVIREIAQILRGTFPKSIEIKLFLQDDLWTIVGDATQMYQVLMNLCVNAQDAITNGGRVTIRAENVYVEEGRDGRVGRFVLITVADTGTGIPAEIIDKIFEPFFTTKEPGKGTGLGLSTALGIVKGHGGFIDVYSKLGGGTEFRVYLPATEQSSGGETEGEDSELPVGNGEMVLVVDDEPAMREMVRKALEAFGYRVIAAVDGSEAARLYAENSGEVKVVLTDLMMPNGDGLETIRALEAIDPQVTIIASSGLSSKDRLVEAVSNAVKGFLRKPYTTSELLKTLAEVLDAKRQIEYER